MALIINRVKFFPHKVHKKQCDKIGQCTLLNYTHINTSPHIRYNASSDGQLQALHQSTI